MQEIRCKKCNKLLYKTFAVSDDGAVNFDKKVCLKSIEYGCKEIRSIQTQCPRCKELNTNNV